jgi:serine/threonine protein kinase/formylglycine-generating enzyme required for sulfatase activity
MSDSSTESLDKRLEKILFEMRAGEKPNFVAFLKEVPKPQRADYLRPILRCHLEVRRSRGKELSADLYGRFGKRAVEIAAEEITKLESDSTPSDLTATTDATIEIDPADYCFDDVPQSKQEVARKSSQFEMTQDSNMTARRSAESEHQNLSSIDRYRIDRMLGEGGFGSVYLGFDEKLERLVAIKLPHASILKRPGNVERYLSEARTVANLDHPNIVPVHDVGTTEEHPFFIVSKFIEGNDLDSVISEKRLTFRASTQMVATIAKGLHHAHKQGIVHRDIKPGNILVDNSGVPHIVDFGLAWRDQDPMTPDRQIIGSPAYMSPEQARGEGHRVNGRSDIFSLGILLYELLTGRRPFNGSSINEVLGQVLRLEPRPLRQYDERIPYELERICLKAISKKAEQRYSTAFDMAEDLELCLQEDFDSASLPTESVSQKRSVSKISLDAAASQAVGTHSSEIGSESKEISIVPKGLRSFDVHDADFFLQLLPGARDRFGFPDSVRFWRTKIEAVGGEEVFDVGLIYGPSGCGKSSFIKSGLLPHLSESVVPVYIESTPEETESRLLGGIQRQLDRRIEGDLDLSEVIAKIRRGAGLVNGKKLLLVLDQFEQWLHARTDLGSSELVNAIRQCDGRRVQCIVSVRDDFWMAATRFMKELEVRLEDGRNCSSVDLFPARHARNVLLAFGKAYGALPHIASELTDEHRAFLDEAIDALQVDQKVICVRLALFAEMMKNREWSPHSLADVGGIEGLRVSYFEETFGQQSSHPKYRLHEKGVRSVLKQLMPEPGTDIKGKMKSWDELKYSSEYESDEKFDELIQVLDNETRLITPTDREGSSHDSAASIDRDQRCYQLAHDYLVPSIDTWLALKQRETKRGRTELLLESRSSLWNAKPENRQLPTLVEYLGIRRHTKSSQWSKSQKTMMSKASRLHGVRAVLATFGILLVAGAGWFTSNRNVESSKRQAAESLVNTLLNAKTEQVPQIVSSMDKSWPYVSPVVQKKLADYPADSAERLHLSLALVEHDSAQVDYLLNRLEMSNPEEVSAIRIALGPHQTKVVPKLWSIADSDEGLLPAVAVLAMSDREAKEKWEDNAKRIVDQLLKENVLLSAQWLRLLDPVDQHFYETLKWVYLAGDESRTQRERDKAKDFLVQSARKDWAKAAELTIVGVPGDFNVLFDLFSSRPDDANTLINGELESATGAFSESGLNRATNAAIAALRIGRTEDFLQRLNESDDPSLRTSLIAHMKQSGVDLKTVLALRGGTYQPSVERAILQTLGSYEITETDSSVVNAVLQIFELNLDPGVHSSARWLLRRWGKATEVDQMEMKWAQNSDLNATKLNWYVAGPAALSMVVVRGPVEFNMGSPDYEPGRGDDEAMQRIKINRSFAIGATEVTVGQFNKFTADTGLKINFPEERSPTDQHPMIGLSWFQAAKFCRWLSEKEGLEESQMCYPPISQIKPGMKLPDDFLTRTGYRLPTEAEWEFSCRSGTASSRFFGRGDSHASRYAWGLFNTRDATGIVASHLPNDLGLFDTYGNVGEWCQQIVKDYSDYEGEDRVFETVVTEDKNRTMRGGSFTDLKPTLRSALRTDYDPTYRSINFGLRVARTIEN